MMPRALDIGLRLALALMLAAAAVPAYRHAELGYQRVNEPEAAYRSRPGDAPALAQVLSERFAANPAYVPSGADRAHLRQALQTRPLQPELLAAQGLALAAQQKPVEALAAMRLADRISRRGSLASLWLIEAASTAGDVPRAVGHYHNALSVHPALRETLLPVLARGIVHPEIRAALRPYLSRPANWAGDFLQVALREASLADLQELLTPLPGSLRNERFQPLLARLLQRGAAEGEAGVAGRLAGGIMPDFDPRTLSRLDFSASTLDPRLGPLGWTFASQGGVSTRLIANETLEVGVEPLSGGQAAARDIVVEAGRHYAFLMRLAFSERVNELSATWTATCVGQPGGAPFWTLYAAAVDAGETYEEELVTPEGCRLVTFALKVQGPDGQSPATSRISSLGLRSVH
jgi:hypothetical protein